VLSIFLLLPFERKILLLFGQAVLATELDIIMQSNQATKTSHVICSCAP